MARIQDIKNALVTKISEITDFTNVLPYVKYEWIWSPTVFIKYRWCSSEKVDTIRDLEKHNFELSIIYDYDNDQEAEVVLISLVEKVIDKLKEDITLWNLLQYLDITSVEENLEDDIKKIKVYTFSLECALFTNRWYV